MKKYLIYTLYLLVLIIDLDLMRFTEVDQNGETIRYKHVFYYTRKMICISIKLNTLYYEFTQLLQGFYEYVSDMWNYIQVLGIVFYISAAVNDMIEEEVSDTTVHLYVCSLLFSLYNYLFLVRVFNKLSFLVKMLNQVILDVKYFIVLFTLFVVIFAQCFSVLGVDVSSYGRIPHFFAHVLTVYRIAFGDFGLINTNYGFDLPIGETEEMAHSRAIVVFTCFICMLSSFMVCMILQNFIIAVISDSYS